MSEATPQVRVGDRERRAVDDRLMAAVGDGVLTLHEYDERSAALWSARTRGELDQLVADLPAEPVAAAARAPHAPVDGSRSRRVVAVMSDDRLSGALTPGQDVRGYALMGRAVIDLRRGDLPDSVQVRVRALMGGVEVLVPAGADVHLSGFSLMGDRTVEVGASDGPSVHVDAVAVMGSVKVSHGDGTIVETGGRTGAVPAPRTSSPVVALHPGAAHGSGGRLSRLRGRATALLVPAVVLGAVVLAGPDNVSVFADGVEQVAPDDRSVQVSTLFGRTTVVVPDGSRVDTGGLLPFGETTCEGDCATGEGPEVHVRSFGAFGTVTVVTRSQYAAAQEREQAEEEAEEAEEQREDRADD